MNPLLGIYSLKSPQILNPFSYNKQAIGSMTSLPEDAESNRGRPWALPLQTAFPLAVSSLLCVLLPQAVLAVLVPLVSPQLPAGLTLPGLA